MSSREGLSPFGDPDGARADLDDVTRGFVGFPNPLIWGGLSSNPSDLRARLFVGRKGSGKTLYLRRSREFTSLSSDVYSLPLEVDPPDTSSVMKFCELFPKYQAREYWKAAWRRAITRASISTLLHTPELRAPLSDDLLARFENAYSSLLPPSDRASHSVGIFDCLKDILFRCRTQNAATAYLHSSDWSAVEGDLTEALRSTRPVCFYVDSVDDNFQHAPMHWLECQFGLFECVIDLLRDPRFGQRLHVFAAIRDFVYIKKLQGEHALRNVTEQHIRLLNWDAEAIKYLLGEKVRRLDRSFFKYRQDHALRGWLGLDEVHNLRRGITEGALQYLLRHTRHLPRDVIVLGNLLCQELERSRWFNSIADPADAVRRAVHFASKLFGDELLAICAHQIVVDMLPGSAGRQGYAETYTGNFKATKEYVRTLVDDLRSIIFRLGRDRFGRAKLDSLRAAGEKRFGTGVDIATILWLNGALGYVDGRSKDCVTFFFDLGKHDFRPPERNVSFALHSCLIDSTGVKGTGRPVIPCPGV
jgi:hypothetical protein